MKPKLEKRIAALESKRISQSFIVFIVPAGATDDCTVAYEYDGCTIHREVGEPLDALKARITEAFEGYKNYLVSKKILSQREAQNLKFEKVNNEQKTWTNVVKVSLNGKQYPSENKLYRCPAYKKNGKGYFLKGFSI